VKRLRTENDALSEETQRLRKHIKALEERYVLVEALSQLKTPSRSRFVRFIRSLVCRLC